MIRYRAFALQVFLPARVRTPTHMRIGPIGQGGLPSPRHLFCLLLAGTLLIAGFSLRMRLTYRNWPYVLHVDEPYVVNPALKVLQRETLNTSPSFKPRAYPYPSFPIYLMAAGAGIGAGLKRWLRPSGASGSPEPGDAPVYRDPWVVVPQKVIVAALSTATIALAGVLAALLSRSWTGALGAMALLFASPRFFRQGAYHVNVDAVGAFFVLAGLVYLVRLRTRSPERGDGYRMGLWTGLCAACKYPLGLVGLSFLAHLWLERRGELRKVALRFAGILAAACLLGAPMFVVDWEGQSATLQRLWRHYGGVEVSLLSWLGRYGINLKEIARDLGPASSLLVLGGVAYGLWTNSRRHLPLLLFPITLLAFVSLFPSQFYRNILSLYALAAAYGGVGLAAACRGVGGRWPRSASIAGAAVLALCLALSPWRSAVALWDHEDSRVRFVEWLRDRVPRGARVLIGEELWVSLGDWASGYRLELVRAHDWPKRLGELGREPAYLAIPVLGNPLKQRVPEGWDRGVRQLPPAGRFFGNPVRTENYPSFQRASSPRILVYRYDGTTSRGTSGLP